MADIRVERKGGSKTWQWILLALVVLGLALVLLYRAGYVSLPTGVGTTDGQETPVAQLLLSETAHLEEA